MTAGRKPKPTWLKVVSGNPGKRPLNTAEPVSIGEIGPPPSYFNDLRRAIWSETAAVAPWLCSDARSNLEMYCVHKSNWITAEEKREKYGSVVLSKNGIAYQSPWANEMKAESKLAKQFMTELGLTPSSRSRVSVSKPKTQASNPFEDLKELGD